MKINRQGFNRTVILTRKYAFKFPTLKSWRDFLFGLLNNQTEARVGKSGRDGVCPVRWYIPGGWLVVMPRLSILTEAQFSSFDVLAFETRHSIVVEHKPDSFGLYEGQVVAVDYGWGN